MDRRVDHLPLPGAAPAVKKGGSLPPLPPPPVRRHDVPCEAGTRGAGAARRFAAEDLGNPCQPMSNAGFQAQPGPQRRGLRPLIVQICSCQIRAPPACATPRLKGGHPYDGTALTPGGGNYRSILLRLQPPVLALQLTKSAGRHQLLLPALVLPLEKSLLSLLKHPMLSP